MNPRRGAVCLLVLCGWLACGSPQAAAQENTADLKRMSLEDLLQLEATTVTRRPEATGDIPAAVSIITADDIRRAGATSLPEALRLAPGVQVARIDGGRWATGIRGFSDRLSRAMLVMIDGRAVYSPLFAGTYWEVQDVMLEDVDRIEVIRGPGGTLWGANAVNGIINIVRKPAAETQGLLVSAEGGTFGLATGALRYGGARGAGQFKYRLYAKGLQRPHEFETNDTVLDRTRLAQAGGRGDWTLSGGHLLTIQGDAYRERLGEQAVHTSYVPPYRQVTNVRAPLAGGNVLARLSGAFRTGTEFQLQTYYDRTSRDEIPVGEIRDTVDVDYQQTQRPWGRQRLSFGGGYRVTSGLITAVSPSALTPRRRTDNLFSLFAQDELTLIPERLRATVGAKIERNSYTGIEAQPGVRLLWTPSTRHSVFASVTRAVRTPSRVETDYTTTSLVSPAGPSFVRLVPNPGFRPEELIAYESGYRVRASSRAYLTVSAFYNALNDILSTELMRAYAETIPPGPPHTVTEVMFRNGLFGEAHGAEITADVRPVTRVRTTMNYSYLRVATTRDPGAIDLSQERRYEGITPRHQLQAQAALDLPARVSLDVIVRHASAMAAGPVPAYTTTTARLAWRVTPAIELSIVGQNLTDPRHLEWPGALPIQRSVFGKMVVVPK